MPTASCIWKSFQTSGKKHLILTGDRGSGKTTLLSALFPCPMPGLTSWAVPKQGVYLKDNFSSKAVQIGRFNPDSTGAENRMLPVLDAFSQTGVSFLRACADVSSDWITIDEIGYLESTCPEYQNALSELMACKHLLMVVRKQKLPFLDSLLAQQDVFVLDLDQPYGSAGCILMASGQGRRFGENKLLTDLAGKPLIQWALDASAGLFAHRLVVTVHKEIEQLCLSQDIPVLLHPFPDRNDMIRLGMGEISSFIDRCAFLPSDQPMILPETIASLLLCAKNLPDFIWRPCSSDTVGSPVIFPSCFFEELKNLPPKKGGNVIVSRYPNLVRTLPVSYSEELKDIDTKEELLAVSQYLEQQSSNRRWRFDDCGAFAP